MYQGKFQKGPKGGTLLSQDGNNLPETKPEIIPDPKSGNTPNRNDTQKQPVKKSRKVSVGTIVFYSLLGLFILIFCIVLGVAMNALNRWLVQFEAAQPTYKSEAVFAELFADPDWKQIYELAGDQGEVTAEIYANHMEQKVGDTELTYIETSAGLGEKAKYIVLCDSEQIATFLLYNAKPEADIPDWQLEEVKIFHNIPRFSVTVLAGLEHSVLVNGQTLDESHLVRTVATKAEEHLPEGIHGYGLNELVVHDLLTEPEVQILDAQGNPLEVHYDSQTRCYSVEVGSPEITEEHRQTLVTAAETYSKYMIRAATLADLRNCFDNRSEIYRTITESDLWIQNYARYELSEAEITDYYCYSDEYYSARVSLTLDVVRKNGTVKEYAMDQTFFVKKAGDQWLVWEMINSNPQETVTNVRLTYLSGNQMIHTEMVNAQSAVLSLPQITAPEGKTFTGWFIQTVDEQGAPIMELAFEPTEDGTVRLPSDMVLEPMTLYALYQ